MNTVTEEYKKQWSKFMFSFFDYLPTKYEATQKEWAIRQMIWDFKNGKRSQSVAEMVARKIRQQFGANTGNIVFACIPASNEPANKLRYETFSEEVCRLAGTVNAYKAITIEGERLAIHESKGSKFVNNVQVISFDKSFFKSKRVLVFDDIVTQGFSYARFACVIESFGAEVVGGCFLGRTLMK